jgi:TatD DNase family protein
VSRLPPLADTHCHLCLEAFAGDLPEVLERARQAGVERILVPGIDLDTSRRAVELAESHAEIYAAVGVHPHSASAYDAQTRRSLRQLAESPRVVAVGEIGLDYYRDRSPREMQRTVFADQLDLAAELSLPVVIHNRDADADVLARALAWAEGRARPGVMHAFSGDGPTATAATQAGFFLGVAGPLTFPNAAVRRIIIGEAPPGRIVLETDAPYLSPQPLRGRRNEPANVALVAEALSGVWQRDPADTRRTAWDNAAALFRWTHGTDDCHLL